MNVLHLSGFIIVFGASVLLAASPPALAAADKTMPTCSAGDSVVWENTKSGSRVYHVQGDKYYGNTSNGKYVCKSDADAAGYHAAGSGAASGKPRGRHASPSASASPEQDDTMSPDPGATGMHVKHKHHHKGSASSPAPSTDPSPSATGT